MAIQKAGQVSFLREEILKGSGVGSGATNLEQLTDGADWLSENSD